MSASFTNLSDLYNYDNDYRSLNTTSLDDIMNDDILPRISFVNTIQPIENDSIGQANKFTIQCTNILDHVNTCPVCSLIYKSPTDNREQYKNPPSNGDDKEKKLNNYKLIIFIGILLIIILLLIKQLISKRSK